MVLMVEVILGLTPEQRIDFDIQPGKFTFLVLLCYLGSCPPSFAAHFPCSLLCHSVFSPFIMPLPCPHPFVLFSLVPTWGNEPARSAVSHHRNLRHRSISPDGTLALNVGPNTRETSSKTLATVGCGNKADIYVEGLAIYDLQCSFEINPGTGAIMLYDRSFPKSTQVFGKNSAPFELDRDERKILVHKNINTIIGMGGAKGDLIQFELHWHSNHEHPTDVIKQCGIQLGRSPIFPNIRSHSSNSLQTKMRYIDIGPLGSGQFGKVRRAIDVDSGNLMAVKILHHHTERNQEERWKMSFHYALNREVEILKRISHPHIVDYITSQECNGSNFEIFMGLKEGTLASLINPGSDMVAIANSVFPQMLMALDFLANEGIIHRDLKPENILYIVLPNGQYHFQLGDFGLCNRVIDAKSSVGSQVYMAPEIYQNGLQTSKADVWSLFVTMLWTLDLAGLRQTYFTSALDAQSAVLHAAANERRVSRIRDMAIYDPEIRASAAQMLVKCFEGKGLSTPRNQIPTLARSVIR